LKLHPFLLVVVGARSGIAEFLGVVGQIFFPVAVGAFESDGVEGRFSVVVGADVVAEGGEAGVAESAATDKLGLFDEGPHHWLFLLDGLELLDDLPSGHSVERALGREAVVLLPDVHGQRSGRLEGLVLAATQVDLLEFVLDDGGVVEPPNHIALGHSFSLWIVALAAFVLCLLRRVIAGLSCVLGNLLLVSLNFLFLVLA
jgi:hypothetical protein